MAPNDLSRSLAKIAEQLVVDARTLHVKPATERLQVVAKTFER
ncbi:hypothetical protein [Amycolatopsis sp. NPDC051128]